jgi:antitoxin CptB
MLGRMRGIHPEDAQNNTSTMTLDVFAAYIPHPRRRPGFWRSEFAKMTGTTRSSDGLDERRKRLLYRAWHRGMREMDLIMGRFADATIGEMSEAEVEAFERLSEVPDPELYAWIVGGAAAPPQHDTAVLRHLRAFHHGEPA